MENNKLNDFSVKKLNLNEIKNINGGSKGGWIAGVYEVIDVITSAGENLKEAYQNGYELGKS